MKEDKVRFMDSVLTAILDNTIIHDPTDWISPTNDKIEEAKFFEKIAYNPQYTYDRCKFDNDKVRKALADLGFSGMSLRQVLEQIAAHEPEGIERVLENKRADLLNKMDLAESLGTNTTELSIRIYGKPDQELLEEAYRILRDVKPTEDEKTVDSNTAAESLSRALEEYGGWSVVVKAYVASKIKTTPSKKLISIEEGSKFSPTRIKRIKVHEIRTHVRRSENGEKSGLGILRYGTKGYLPTEEGLATVMEERAGVLDASLLRKYAARVIAVNEALTKPFSAVYETVRKLGFSDSEAYQLTKRAKRGLTNTSQPGGFIKDHVYLEGKRKVERWLREGRDIDDLFLGKIGIDDVAVIKQYLSKLKA